jgi:S-adenosyl methyltransferase
VNDSADPGHIHAVPPLDAEPSGSSEGQVPAIDSTTPHSARIWNYWLGGKDNFAIDRIVGDQVLRAFPDIVRSARAQRAFLVRAITYLAKDAGIRQFLDVGTGLPTAENTHEVAQRFAADARIAYVDNDPVVLTHARALLRGTPEGATSYIDADVRDSEQILELAAEIIDFSQPVALILLGILGHLPSHDEAAAICGQLVAGLASGSYLVIADGSNTSAAGNAAQAAYNRRSPAPYHLRSPAEIASYFSGLELLEPGVVSCSAWRPDPIDEDDSDEVPVYCAVARKP